jgi:integrase
VQRGRRAKGEGSIAWSEKHQRWEVKIDLPPGPNGKRRRARVTARTEAEAVRKLDEMKRRTVMGQPATDKRTTVGAYLEDWLEQRAAIGDIAEGTLRNYKDVNRLYLNRHLGRVKLTALTPQHVERAMAAMMAGDDDHRPVSARTAQLARAVLRKALTDAVREGLLPRNAAQLARAPRQERREGRTLSPEQGRALLAATADHRLHAAFVVSLMLGLRRGEVLGLTWGDVDLDGARLTVRHQLQRTEAGLRLVDTKTAGSVRALNMPKPVVDALRAHRAANPGTPAALVFTSESGGPYDPDNWRRLVYATTEKVLGEKWSPHELRHSAASILLGAGVPLKIVSEVLGHSSIRITADVYSHLLESDRTAAEAMERALG